LKVLLSPLPKNLQENKIFINKFYEILPRISEGAVHIFDWIISFFKAYSGYTKFGEINTNTIDYDEDPHEITLRTKMKIRKEIERNRTNFKKQQKPVKIPNEPKFISPEGKADKEYYNVQDEKTDDNEEDLESSK